MSFKNRFSDWWNGRIEEEGEDLERMVLEASELHGVAPKKVIRTVFDEEDLDEAELLDDDDEYEDKPRSKVAAFVSYAFIGLVFGGGIVTLMWLAKQADKAGPEANSGIQAINKSIQPTPAINSKLFGFNVYFSYPPVFNTVATLPNLAVTSERYMIGSSSDYRRSISVMVDNFPDLGHDPNYLYRVQDKADYTPQPVMVHGEPALVMVKSDGTERTLFWAHEGHIVIVSVVSSNSADTIAAYMAQVVNTVGWRVIDQ